MKKIYIIVLMTVASLLTFSCQQKIQTAAPGTGSFRTISVSAASPEVKSLLDPTSDIVYVYTFSESKEFLGIFSPAMSDGYTFTYNIPDDTYLMVFTNMANSDVMEVTSENNPLVFKPLTLTEQDMVIAREYAVSIPDDGSPMQIHLERIASKVTVDLVLKSSYGTDLDPYDFIQYAGVAFPGVYEYYYLSNYWFLRYSGTSVSQSVVGMLVSESSTRYNICNDVSILPSYDASSGAVMELTVIDKAGYSTTLSATLNYPLEANKRYRLEVSLRPVDTGFGFTVEDIVTEDIIINLN